MAYQDPPQDDGGEGTVVNGKVKWFRADKGYGFVTPDDNSGDIFLHVSVLKRRNIQDVPQGSTISCEVVQGQKGRQVSRILDLDVSTATPTPPRRPREPGAGFNRDFRGPRNDAPRYGEPHDRGPGPWADRGDRGPPRLGDRGDRPRRDRTFRDDDEK